MPVRAVGAGRSRARRLAAGAGRPGRAAVATLAGLARSNLAVPAQITVGYGSSSVWPGDTTGLSMLSPTDVVASWGSDYANVSGNQAEIYTANIAVTLP
jgi:hypothetical protein